MIINTNNIKTKRRGIHRISKKVNKLRQNLGCGETLS